MIREHRMYLAIAALTLFLIGTGICIYFFRPDLYGISPGNTDAERGALLAEGLHSFESGNVDRSRTSFEQAARMSPGGDERAQYEMLVALTYERTDLARSVEMYQAVMGNIGYSPRVRALAGTYLLLALGNEYAPEIAATVFADGPWQGFLRPAETSSPRVNYETALTRGYRWINENLTPNFLSLLLPGEYYARVYGSTSNEVQTIVAPYIPRYYAEGARLLDEAKTDTTWHPNLIATGLRSKAQYMESYAALIESGTLSAPLNRSTDFTDENINAAYIEFTKYVEQRLTGPIKNVMVLTGSLSHAHFLVSNESSNTAQLTQLAEKLAALIANDLESANNVQSYGLDRTGQHRTYRSTLIALAAYAPALKDALLSNTTSFKAVDFVTQ